MSEDVIHFDGNLERRLREEFGEEATPEFMNMLRLGKAAYEHGYHGFIPKEIVLKWVAEMYDGGQKQKAIRNGEAHGSININSGDVLNAGSYLSLFGKREGYLSKSKEEEVSATNPN